MNCIEYLDIIIKVILLFNLSRPVFSRKFSEALLLSNERVCPSLDIRRNNMNLPTNCTVIEGDLYIALFTFTTGSGFPLLKEITGSLVIYYLEGIKSLDTYFPNLVIIRGQTLTYNYALVIKGTSLITIGLINLRVIMSGGVRIDNNLSLCYVNKVNWDKIVRQRDSPIKLKKNGQYYCPDFCPNNNRTDENMQFCWSHKTFQNVCSDYCVNNNLTCFMNNPKECCHPECLGGCYGHGNHQCVSCRNVLSAGRCVRHCNKSYYKYKDRRCISEKECWSLSSQSFIDNRREKLYAIEDGSCVKQCSPGRKRNPITGHCLVCDSECSNKFCGCVLIHSINDLSGVDGCYSIEEVYISIKEGGSSLFERLVKAFSKLKIVENSLKIVRSPSITSLSFLKSLRMIKGNSTNKCQNNRTTDNANKSIVFEVYDNENLVEISNEKSSFDQLNITILQGSVSFNLNRKLCPEKIITFLNSNTHMKVKLTELEEKIINISNGDMAFCKHEKLIVKIISISESSFAVKCYSKISDSLLQYSAPAALFMLKETMSNISQYELFSSCSEQNWRTVEGYIGKEITIGGLLPAKRYALYVEAIRSRVENWLEISDLIYLTTKRKKPSHPVNLKSYAISNSEIRLTWDPPVFPNGIITKYVIQYRSLEIFGYEFPVDVCHTTKITKQPSQSQLESEDININSNHECDCNECMAICNKNKFKINVDKDDFIFQFLDDYITQSFKKQNEIPISNWLPKDSDNIEIKTIHNNDSVFDENLNSKSSMFDPNNRTEPKSFSLQEINRPMMNNFINLTMKRIEVPANQSFHIFTNLNHYTEYLFEIQACQDSFDDISSKSKISFDNFNSYGEMNMFCSLKSSISAHTKLKENMDIINESTIKFEIVGNCRNSLKICWSAPLSPNGLILKYTIQYEIRTCNSSDKCVKERCFPRSEWAVNTALINSTVQSKSYLSLYNTSFNQQNVICYTLEDLDPNDYSFKIQPVSIARDGLWTYSFFFTINHCSVLEMYIIIGSILILVMLGVIMWLLYRYYKKRYIAKTKWVSSNPDYWIIYEIDAWEIDRKDVDMIEWSFPLGRGSFGMVYKGKLRNLTTPARHQILRNFSLNDMYVAVKTLNTNSTILERREFINEACYMKQFQSYHLVKLFGIVSKVSDANKKHNKYQNKKYRFIYSFMSRIRRSLNSFFTKRINLFALINSKKSEINDKQLDDISSAQLDSFRTAISQHFDKMPLVIMELMEFGDLAGYLRKQGEEGEGLISENQSHLWAMQIADGMLYLSDMKFVHRDLAARNCMINSSLIIKIGDFGMARDIYYNCYYRKEGKGRLPVRWMAPESFVSAYFSTSSDVWSYGIILWEISTLSSLPYRGMSHDDVIQYVTSGGSLLNNGSFSCSKLLHTIMEKCWQYLPDNRPTFHEIVEKLESHSDQNFKINSYYFQQKDFNLDNQEMPLINTQLDIEYSINNLIQES